MVSAGLILAWMIWLSRADELVQEEPGGAWFLPFQIREDLKLARGSQPFERGSLRLVCTSTRELRLLLQTVLPKRELLRVLENDKAELFINHRLDEELVFEQAELVGMGSVDTILTEPLSQDQLSELARLLDESWLKRFSFMTLERGTFLLGFTDGTAIHDLANRCLARS
jgi:hypothetical protein